MEDAEDAALLQVRDQFLPAFERGHQNVVHVEGVLAVWRHLGADHAPARGPIAQPLVIPLPYAPAHGLNLLVALQLVTVVAAVPLKVTVLVPCVAPKFVPVMVIDTPTAPEV